MIKKVLYTFISVFIFFAVLSLECQAQHTRTFVRKKVQPNYFIPEREIKTKVEKLPQPKFTAGKDTSVTQAKPLEQPKRIVKTAQENTIDDNGTNTPTQDLTNFTEKEVENQADSTPDYQKKYQEYIADLDSISNNKEAKYEGSVAKDLSKMNSNERIIVDKKFNQKRDVKGKFNNTLNQVLSK